MPYEIPVLTQIAQVQRYVEKHGGCTTEEIARELDISQNVANMQVQRLRDKGKVRRVKIPGKRAIIWWPGKEENYIARVMTEGIPKQKTVSEWEPCKVRDPLIDLLFGRTTALAERS